VKIWVENHTDTPLEVTVHVSFKGALDAEGGNRLKLEEMEIVIEPYSEKGGQ